MVIGGSFYATMLAVFGFGIVLFKTQAFVHHCARPLLRRRIKRGDHHTANSHGIRDSGAPGSCHLRSGPEHTKQRPLFFFFDLLPPPSGGAYGMMSASWDPDKEGSALGTEESVHGFWGGA